LNIIFGFLFWDSRLNRLREADKIIDTGDQNVARLKNAAESERETILSAYRSYLSEVLQADGKACVGTRQAKPKTNKVKPLPTETVLPEDVQTWALADFVICFLQEYRKVTGKKNHANKSRATGKTFEQCIKDLEDHYRDYERAEREPMMKKHIDAFFVNYPPPLFTPTVFLMANSDTLLNIERYLETSVKHVPYEERLFKDKKSQSELRAQQAREAKQENKGMSREEFRRRISGL
jgi:hypothetical protein